MRSQRSFGVIILCSLALLCLILDTKTALTGAAEGLKLCISSAIPSLFPFLTITILLNNALTGRELKILQPAGRLLGVPKGAESLLLLGLVGGYPVGAHCINEAYRTANLQKSTGQRLLGFCSNAGPAFIFGMMSGLFTDKRAVWCLWGIHILSALTVGVLLPGRINDSCRIARPKRCSLSDALHKSIRTMAEICSWVILFRVLLAFLQRWFLWLFSSQSGTAAAGLLELTNGCHLLYNLPNQGLRFVMGACFLSFGGICVLMQTMSVTKDIGIGLYFPGKLLHSAVSFILACGMQHLLFPTAQLCTIPSPAIWSVCLMTLMLTLYLHRKKVVAFRKEMLYNVGKI